MQNHAGFAQGAGFDSHRPLHFGTGTAMKILLDTDIGSDIDDAVCLAYLLRQPQCELLGITTVTGDVQQRAALADAVCRAAGRTDIPIVAGCRAGILRGAIQPDVPQAKILDRFEHRPPVEFAPNNAVQFLREQIHAHPGEITLLGIGPMTNLGLLFASDPAVAGKLKQLVLMCGVFTPSPDRPPREWNAHNDPIATAAVYQARIADHVSIGLDVTLQCRIANRECIDRFRQIGGPLAVVAAATEVWAQQTDQITFHDPLAATVIFHPELCTFQTGTVTVDERTGTTVFAATGNQHRIATQVNVAGFFAEYFAVVS